MLTPWVGPWATLVGLTGWPGATPNRTIREGSTSMMLGARETWSPAVEEMLAMKRSPVSLRVTAGGCNPVTKIGYLTVEVFFHQPVTANLRLSIAQVEDGFNWRQTFYPPSGPTQYLYPYFHENVLRQMIPNDVFGEIITTGTRVASQSAITKTLWFQSKDSLRAKSRFVIFVHNSDGRKYGEVLQSIEHELTELTDASSPFTPQEFTLAQNYPNPFSAGSGSAYGGNSSTFIEYGIPGEGFVSLQVRDALGRIVRTLVREEQAQGVHRATFDGSGLPSGIYFYTLQLGTLTLTRKMTLLK